MSKKKKSHDGERTLTLSDICDTVDVLRLEDTMEVSPAVKMKRDLLKKDVRHVLSKRPDGLHLSEVWNTVSKETGRVIEKRSYEVSRLTDLIHMWTDEFVIKKERIYLKEGSVSAGFHVDKNYKDDFPLPSGPSGRSGRETRGPPHHSLISSSSESDDSDDDDVHIVETVEFNSSRYGGSKTAGNGKPTTVTKQASLSPNEISIIRNEVLNILPQHASGIKHSNLYQKLPCAKHLLDRMLKEWGVFPKFLEDQMSDVLLVDNKLIKMKMGAIKKERNPMKDQTAMSVMSSLSLWGAPARPGTSKQETSKLVNQGSEKEAAAKVPSFDFISLVDDDDDEDDGKKSRPVDTVDLTGDTPERLGLRSTSQFQGPPSVRGPVPLLQLPNIAVPQGMVPQQQLLFNQGQPLLLPRVLMQNPPFMVNVGLRGPRPLGPSLTPQVSPVAVSNTPLNNQPINLGAGVRTDTVNIPVKHVGMKEFEYKDIVVHPVNIPRDRPPPRDYVDNIAKECIEILADADQFVALERVEKLVCQRFQINNVRQIGYRFVSQIPCVNELERLQKKVHTYIVGFVKTRSICTLHELKESLREYVPNKEDFSKLKLGPLQRSPVVFEQFKFPPDQAEIPEISSIDVLEHFRNFLTKKNLWTSKLTLEPFMDYLVEEYNAENAYYLGVRITSLPLAAATLKKAQRDAGANRRSVYDHYKDQLKSEIEDAFRKFRATMLQTGEEDGMEVRRHYMKMRPDLVVMEIFEKFNLLMTVTQMGEAQACSHGQQKRMVKVMNDFVSTVKNDGFFKSLFHLAICMSSTAIEEATMALLAPRQEEKENQSEDQDKSKLKPPPRIDKLIESVKTYIQNCLNAGSLSLSHLDRIEERLLEDFGFGDFHLMGYGRFLHFLITESKTKQALEEGGGLVLGSSSGSDKDALFKPHQTDVQEFIKQCKLCGLSQSGEIEDALCKQYGVKEVRHLGYGNITRLLNQADKHRLGTDFTVFYQSTLTKPTGNPLCAGQKVGVLGHQTRDLAKICLHNCPLLEDLSDWSQWRQVFEPELGKLKDFIQKYGGVSNKTLEGGRLATLDFLALETKPGVLLKIVSDTSPELVAGALERRDIFSFCGHLVSMVIAYKGVNNIPKALLYGHIKTALLQLHAADPSTDTPGAPSTYLNQNSASQFVLQCLLRIPTKICVDLADDLFLSPLGQVVGSTKFKQLLVQLCSTVHEQNQLTELGCLLGIQEWTDLVAQKCILSEASIQMVTPDVEELFKDETQEQEEENSSDESDTEDLEEIISGATKPALGQDNLTAGGTVPPEDVVDVDKVIDEVEVMEINKEHDAVDVDDDDDVKIVEGPSPDAETLSTEDGDVIIDEVKARTCEDIVNEIRKEEFGVGIHLSEDGQKLMKIQQQRLGRSLDRLSKDLYSKDTHFVLELVQNADDNSYHDDLLSNTNDVCPSVKFIIDHESVRVRNNELGFQERDIRALCDVGRSTKGKHKFGYIGQKGIGFKSVFRVTDMPEIHSNGYHIKFDVKSGPMGYILPHWEAHTDKVDENWMTNIILTLKPDMRLQTRTLAARFNDIHPSLLLFLHRLREITIENKVENSIQTMRRRDVGDNIIEIQHTGGLDRWLVIKKRLDASKISSQAKSGADVESTEIALAFPIKHAAKTSHMQGLPPKQLVFAFLPLRSYGFRFIVQGDFDVPSSREDVDRDSSWNQWLRNEIHTVFLDSLEMFKNHQDFSNIEAVISFLQFVPMEDEVLDFFKPVASDILKKLKARPCVPTQPNNQGVISWKIPSQTVRVRDPLVRSVITPDLLQTHLNLHYLHPDVAAMLNPTLTSCLGIETLTSDHLFQLGKALIVNMGDIATLENVLLIARWLACIYRSLDEFQDDDAILSTLKSLQMLPLSDGKLVSLQTETVFYPIPNSDTRHKKEKDPLYYLQQDVNSLHPLLLKTEDEEVNSQVHKLLLRLGIKQLSPFDVINHHIIPMLKSDDWKRKSKLTVISYLVYVKEQVERQNTVCNLEEFKDVAQILTNKGIKNPSTEPVHFSHHYGSMIQLQTTFPGYDWTVVDPVYLPPQSTKMAVMSWHDFLVKLGVEDSFSIQKRKVCLKKDALATSVWRGESEFWPQGEIEYIIEDYYCEELESLITNNTLSGPVYQDQMRALCLCLEKLWSNKFSRYTETHVCDKNGQTLKVTNTSFSILLRTSSWLPSIECKLTGELDGSVTQSKSVQMREPSGLYIHSDKLEKLVSNNVLYLDVKLELNSAFHQFLELKNTISIETMKNYLLEWCARSEADIPAVFCTSLNHMKYVYTFLGNQMNRGDLQDLLLNYSIFFVPSRHAGPDQVISGKMLNKNEIWLADKTGLFDKHRGLLEEFHSSICKKRTINSFYGDTRELMDLFRQEGKIDQQPQIEEYIELLSLLCTTSTPKEQAVLNDVLYIFTTIGQALTHLPEAPDDNTAGMILESMKAKVKKKMQKEKVLPTKKGVWVSLNDKPMIADNRDWEKMFVNKEKVHFLDLEDKQGLSKQRKQRTSRFKGTDGHIQGDYIDIFIEVCEVRKLSNCVKMDVTPGLIQPCVTLQRYFHQIVPIMQQFLMAKYEVVYRDLEQKNTRQMLKDANFYQTEKLEVIYRLNALDTETFEIRAEKCVISPPIFYFHKDHVNSIPEVNREIARQFSEGNSGCNNALRSFLLELHTTQSALEDGESVEMLLQRHDADGHEIQDDERWQVESPAIPEPEPEQEPLEDFPVDSSFDNKRSGNKDEPFEMRAWPPVASGDRTKPKEKSDLPTSNIWPPPQAKDYMRTVRDLPSNIRMAAPGEGTTSNKDEDGDKPQNKGETGPSVNGTTVTGQPGPSGDGQGQSGSHGNGGAGQQTVDTSVGNATPESTRKRKLSGEDSQAMKRHSSECKGPVVGDGQTGQSDQSHGDNRGVRGGDKASDVPNSVTSGSDDMPSASQHSTSDRQTRSPQRQAQSPENRPSNIKGAPVWTHVASDYTYDELGSGSDLPDTLTLLNNAGDPEIGRWGENLVACYLQRQKEAGNIIDFKWNNHETETGAPYDFLVHFADETGIHEDFIEVKSTVSEDKEVFEISVQQIKFSEEKKGNFHIYRVFNAGNPDKVRLIRIFDLDLRLSQKQVKLCMVI